MNKKVLGLDLGSNSVGWALLEESDGKSASIIDIGSRIFTRAVQEKVPTPKNVKRRDMRLGRRVLQRRARRKQRMLNYLVSLDLLPKELQGHTQPEVLLNKLGDPYQLRAKALDHKLTPHELGRVLLHFVARRGFLSTRKQAAGDLIDDPDTVDYLNTLDKQPSKDKEETDFKRDIEVVRQEIHAASARTLGEYLSKLKEGKCKRNRRHDGHLRTDRKMYQDELALIWEQQSQYFTFLPDDFMAEDQGVKRIIFYQRPLKLKKNRVGKCSLEPKNYRAAMARLEVQRFRYLQVINNLKYFEPHTEKWLSINDADKKSLITFFEHHPKITVTILKKELGLGNKTKLNLEPKDLKSNITACEIRGVLGDCWDNYTDEEQHALVEDLLSIKKKSALKSRLLNYWKLKKSQAVKLCLLEFEPGHSNHSLKAINKLLPFLKQGLIYSEALVKAGYTYEADVIEPLEKLGSPPETANPIVNRGMHELKRVINALIKEYGKPDIIRIEMARDLEMNTTKYEEYIKQEKKNRQANKDAEAFYNELYPGKNPSPTDKIKYRLWLDQDRCCIYSGETIQASALFTANIEIDHILPEKKSLDNSYMNKVLCFIKENDNKSDRTPKDAWDGNEDKWNQIKKRIEPWKKKKNKLISKYNRFFMTETELQQRDFISSQLNDTRYISRLALGYVKQLGCDVTTTKARTTAWLRKQWGLNNLTGETEKKDRTDHRHHAVDAAVIACVNRGVYQQTRIWVKNNVKKLMIEPPYPGFRNELVEHLRHLIVSYQPQRKLSGGLHEETGANYIEKHGGLVYRKNLTPKDFTIKDTKKLNQKLVKDIVDDTVREIIRTHLAKYDNDPKKAFADNITVYHKDHKTPIKRVRVLQSSTTRKKLEENKFGVKDKAGAVFKWMSYGNIHHVEILKHKETNAYKGEFVTMMQAAHRARGIKSTLNTKGIKQPLIKQNHGDEWQFIMALHINDLVSVASGDEREFYRVQKLSWGSESLDLRLHSAATIKNDTELIRKSISKLMEDGIKKHRMNAIGAFMDDQKNC